MKRFAFPLARVLNWRRAQALAEEMKLDRLHAERSALRGRRQDFEDASLSGLTALTRMGRVNGSDLAALDRYRNFKAAQAARLTDSLRDLDRQIAAKVETVSERRRGVRLIERLRDQAFAKWRAENGKEADRLAEESYLTRWGRR